VRRGCACDVGGGGAYLGGGGGCVFVFVAIAENENFVDEVGVVDEVGSCEIRPIWQYDIL
jgi:hypothetical protein